MKIMEAERTDDLTAYLDLSAAEVARILLCLLIEESLRGRLSVFREEPDKMPAKQAS
jgi:hypothetical protein